MSIANNKKPFDCIEDELGRPGIGRLGSEVQLKLHTLEKGAFYLVSLTALPHRFHPPSKPDPVRQRKLLLKQRRNQQSSSASRTRQLHLVPLNMHYKRGHIKMDIGLAKGNNTTNAKHERSGLETGKTKADEKTAAKPDNKKAVLKNLFRVFRLTLRFTARHARQT